MRGLMLLDFDVHAIKQRQCFWKGELRFQDLIMKGIDMIIPGIAKVCPAEVGALEQAFSEIGKGEIGFGE